MYFKGVISAAAIVLTLVAFLPYLRSILTGTTRPHVFSWIIWGTTTSMVFIAQLADRGGVGAWPIGVSGAITIGIAVLAYRKRADTTITVTDWLFFCAAMSSAPLWYFTADPMWAVILLTTVDMLGFGPTIRKAYAQPASESVVFYALYTLRCILVIVALEHYSVTTVLFPAAVGGACLVLIALLAYRRRVVEC